MQRTQFLLVLQLLLRTHAEDAAASVVPRPQKRARHSAIAKVDHLGIVDTWQFGLMENKSHRPLSLTEARMQHRGGSELVQDSVVRREGAAYDTASHVQHHMQTAATTTAMPTGPPGDQGITGQRGEKGENGNVGKPGFTGLTGLPGHLGSQGKVGHSGKQGPPGAVGRQGMVGDPGPTAKPIDASNYVRKGVFYGGFAACGLLSIGVALLAQNNFSQKKSMGESTGWDDEGDGAWEGEQVQAK